MQVVTTPYSPRTRFLSAMSLRDKQTHPRSRCRAYRPRWGLTWAAYTHESTGPVVNANNASGNGTWEPYRLRVDFPAALGDEFITNRTWKTNGNTVQVKKVTDKWYVTNAVSGKPEVFVDPAVTPSNPPVPTPPVPSTPPASDPPLPEGWVCYQGEVGGVQVVAYRWWEKASDKQDSVSVSVRFENTTSKVPSQTFLIGAPRFYYHVATTVTGTSSHGTFINGIICNEVKNQGSGNVAGSGISSIYSVILSGYLDAYSDGPACWRWQNTTSESTAQGWQWIGSDKGLTDTPALWALPDRDGATDGETVKIQTAVAQALGETDMPAPSKDYEKEVKRLALAHLTAAVAQGRMTNFDLHLVDKWYRWMTSQVFEKLDGRPVIKKKFMTYAALDMAKVQKDLFDNDPSIKTAFESRDNERNRYATLTLGGQPFTEPGGWVAVMTAAGNLNPISAAICLAAGEPILPKAETATWCAAGIAGGFLIIDRLPFSKLGLLFKRGKSLPGEAKPVRKLTKDELVIPGVKVKDIVERDANTINQSFLARVPPQKAPYVPNTKVIEFTTTESIIMVRFHGPTNQQGAWFTLFSEAKGFSNAGQIKQLLALKRSPTHFSIVEIPAGVRVRKGEVKKQEDWGVPEDGGTQFELILPGRDQKLLNFGTSKSITDWITYVTP